MSEENAELLKRAVDAYDRRDPSGAVTESPYANLADVRVGKGIRICGCLDPEEALKAAGSI